MRHWTHARHLGREIREFGLSLPRTAESAADGFPVVTVLDTFLRFDDSETILLRLPHAELDREVEEVTTEAWRMAETRAEQADGR